MNLKKKPEAIKNIDKLKKKNKNKNKKKKWINGKECKEEERRVRRKKGEQV